LAIGLKLAIEQVWEEKEPQDAEHHHELDDNDNPESPPYRHSPKSIHVESHHSAQPPNAPGGKRLQPRGFYPNTPILQHSTHTDFGWQLVTFSRREFSSYWEGSNPKQGPHPQF